jgi:hypothetical protein
VDAIVRDGLTDQIGWRFLRVLFPLEVRPS